jgi:hypothetical protein
MLQTMKVEHSTNGGTMDRKAVPRTSSEASSLEGRRAILDLHLGIWETKALHARGSHKAECLEAVADIKARIADLPGQDRGALT